MDFYENVKILVKKHGFQLIPLLESLEINYSTYKGYKQYGNLPRADEALKIAKALNTTVEFLVTGIEPEITKQDVLNYLQNNLS